ncbi:MAG: ribosome silencing factor [Erysipelotrichaceae bacterium]|nr:ribosome silencing factor [Erysipelotrichaceae bacterium]
MRSLLETAYKAMDEKLAEDLIVLDFRAQSPYVDYFIIGTARNYRMAKSIVDNVEEKALETGFEVKRIYAEKETRWLLVDLGDVVCHVFYDGERQLYNLEGLWKDLPIVQM